jgi:hypothetical protein
MQLPGRNPTQWICTAIMAVIVLVTAAEGDWLVLVAMALGFLGATFFLRLKWRHRRPS